MNILVTGSAGFIGFHLIQKLIQRGDDIIGVDNFNNYYDVNLKKHRNLILEKNKNFKLYKLDFSNFKKIEEVFKKEKIDKVVHLGAQAGVRHSLENPQVYLDSNVQGTFNLLELTRKYKIKDFLFASSSSIYGNNKKVPFSETDNVDQPISLYAATKKSNELMAYTYHHLYRLNCTGLRFFTVYGPWGRPDMAYFLFTKAILQDKPIQVFNHGKLERDFTYIDDIVEGVLKAIEKPFGYEIINLGNNQPVKLGYFIECIEKELGKKAEKKMLPMQPGDVKRTYADISKAKKLLDWTPQIKLEDGMQKFIDWYKEYYLDKDFTK